MKTVLIVLVALAMLATVGVLFAGLVGMARNTGGTKANRFMRYRIGFQFLALALFWLLMMLTRA